MLGVIMTVASHHCNHQSEQGSLASSVTHVTVPGQSCVPAAGGKESLIRISENC